MRSIITVNLTHLKDNFLLLKKRYALPIIAIVKSNAYGHGLIEVSRLFSSLGASMLAVATIEEATMLRKSLITTPILLFEKSDNFFFLFKYQIVLSIGSLDYLKQAAASNLPLMIHLKLETGLHRLGILESEITEALEIIKNSNLKLKGIYTHYGDEGIFQQQSKVFSSLVARFSNYQDLIIHSQSSHYLKYQLKEINTLRVGLTLYGLSDEEGIKPALSLTSPIYRVESIKKQQVIGYHQKGIAPNDGYVYTIPLGYADGWSSSRKTLGYLDDFIPQIGETCMDLMMFFSSMHHQENQQIEIIGDNLPIKALSKLYKSSPYEIVSQLSLRLKRVYKK